MPHMKRKNNLTRMQQFINDAVVQVYTSDGLVAEYSFRGSDWSDFVAVLASEHAGATTTLLMGLFTVLRSCMQRRIEEDIHRAAEWNMKEEIPEEGQLELPFDEDLSGGDDLPF